MSSVLWVIVGVVYLLALVFLGLATLRKGHFILLVLGFFFPVLWIVGALMPPTLRARAAERELRAREA